MLLLSTGLPFEHCEVSRYNGDINERLGIGFVLWYWILDERGTAKQYRDITEISTRARPKSLGIGFFVQEK